MNTNPLDLLYYTLFYYKNLIKTLFEKFGECFCDALLYVKTFWER